MAFTQIVFPLIQNYVIIIHEPILNTLLNECTD